mmetsp:Transcript_21460/g.46394  ORF Transcript_21460/g.46394 Transcript_21460/m.46394 type:complete len:291 (+) Transcript_21460:378-1250(+)
MESRCLCGSMSSSLQVSESLSSSSSLISSSLDSSSLSLVLAKLSSSQVLGTWSLSLTDLSITLVVSQSSMSSFFFSPSSMGEQGGVDAAVDAVERGDSPVDTTLSLPPSTCAREYENDVKSGTDCNLHGVVVHVAASAALLTSQASSLVCIDAVAAFFLCFCCFVSSSTTGLHVLDVLRLLLLVAADARASDLFSIDCRAPLLAAAATDFGAGHASAPTGAAAGGGSSFVLEELFLPPQAKKERRDVCCLLMVDSTTRRNVTTCTVTIVRHIFCNAGFDSTTPLYGRLHS